MPLSTLDSKTALIVIDMQNGVLGLPVAHLVSETVQRTATLADAFHRRRLPVVLVNVTGMAPGRTDEPQVDFNPPTDWADLIDELGAQQDNHTVTKDRWGAFMEPHCTTTCRVKTSPRSSSPALRPVPALSPRPAPRTSTAITSSSHRRYDRHRP